MNGGISVFINPKQCIQRLGFLKPLVFKANQSASNKLAYLGKELISILTKKIRVYITPEIKDYITNTYKGSKNKNFQNELSKNHNQEAYIEVQEYLLSDEKIPSRCGKLVEDDGDKYPYLAVNLRLIKDGTYSVTERGKSFLSLMSDEINIFNPKLDKIQTKEGQNPLILTVKQKLLLLYSFIDADGDVLKPLYKEILENHSNFKLWEVSKYLPNIYRNIVSSHKTNCLNGSTKTRIKRLLKTSETIEKHLSKNPRGSKNALTHNITPRIEPFVDLGLLSKQNPFVYKYNVNDKTKNFFKQLINENSHEAFLRKSFFKTANHFLSIGADHSNENKFIFQEFYKAYTTLRSSYGYASIIESSLLAGINSIVDKKKYFEICEVEEVIKTIHKKNPLLIRFNVTRSGEMNLVKINDILMRKYLESNNGNS